MAIPKIAPYSLNEALSPCDSTVDWQIQVDQAVLLIHDMQSYFVDFYRYDQEPVTTLIKNIQSIIHLARHHNIPIIYTAQPTNQSISDRALLTDFWGSGLQESHQSHHIIQAISPKENDKIYTKWRYSAFQKSTLDEDLRAQKKSQIIICGVYAHIGILSTALEGFMRDYQCFVIDDAIADFSAEEHSWARRWIAGRCGKLLDTNAAINQISAQKHQDFNGGNTLDIKSLLSNILEVPISDIAENDNLADRGLDSMRLMSLVDQLNAAGGNVDFLALAEQPTLSAWLSILNNKNTSSASEINFK